MTRSPRIVITGTGAVCGAGLTIEAIWDAIANGRSAVSTLRRWDSSSWPVRVAAEVTGVDNRTLVEDRKLHKLILRTDLFGIYAADEAIRHSGLSVYRESLDPALVAQFNDRSGVIVGSGGGIYQNNYDFFPALNSLKGDLKNFGAESCSTVNPMWLLRSLPNNVLCHVGIRHNFKGTNACITNQCVGGLMAVAEAAAAIGAGEADRAVAVGHDNTIDPETVLHYHRLGLLSADALRPFDRRRNGTVFGEGAGAVMLEKAEDAQVRGAAVLGEFLGAGCVTEATGTLDVRPDGNGLSRAIQIALDDAEIPAEAVGMIVAHGNGTRASDASEALALNRVFGKSLPPVTAFKWAFGHLIAASGIVDLTLALKAIEQRVVPGIATLQSVDPEFHWLTVHSKFSAGSQRHRHGLLPGLWGNECGGPGAVGDFSAPFMKGRNSQATRCGIDTVEITRVEKLLRNKSLEELHRLFSEQELQDAGEGAGRIGSLAARFAAKEACVKLFPRETALGVIGSVDFSIRRDAYGAPVVEVTANARAVMDRHLIARIGVSLTHTETSASAIAWAEPKKIEVPWFGKLLYHMLPYRRRVVLGNLRRVFGDVLAESDILDLAQGYYAHYARFVLEFVRMPFMSEERRKSWIRIENIESPIRALQQGKGTLLLTGHFGNFEVATVAGIGQFPKYRGLLHFVRRPLKPKLLNEFVTRRFHRAGFGTLAKRGSLDAILDLLAGGAIIVYVLDQHAGKSDGVTVDFFGHPAGTFKSVALLALTTGAPVIPVSSWREPDGNHILRFEDPLPLIECEDVGEAIRRNTKAYNVALERMLLRHPEQWIWMHRRWKVNRGRAEGSVTASPERKGSLTGDNVRVNRV